MGQSETTSSEETYIACIYRLSRGGAVRPFQLAEQMGVKRPSVSRAVFSLVDKGLVRHWPYGDVELTEEGRALGEAILRRGACLTQLLVGVLGMGPEEAAPEVDRLEHSLGEDALIRLETLVEFASSSEGWLKRLRHRIDLARVDK